MTQRVEGGLTYTQTFDAENRLISVTVSGQTTQFIYDGDGNLMKKVKPDNSKTIYVGGIYEVDKASGGSVTRTVTYYPVAGAMRINSTLYYTLKDHLGSASVVTNATGVTVGEQRYYPYGETRVTTGTIYTDKLFTGQREMAGLGIYHYQARFYSPKLGRFLSADTIVPSYANPQHFNRYSYVLGNPLKYTDPTGHRECADQDDQGQCLTGTQVLQRFIQSKYKKVKFKGNWDEDGLLDIYTGLTKISGSNGFNGNIDAFNRAFGAVTFVSVPSGYYGAPRVGGGNWQTGIIKLEPGAVWDTVVHEMGHILDGSLKRINDRVGLYSERSAHVFDAGEGATGYARDRASSSEDFADSFLAVIKYGTSIPNPAIYENRVKTITALIQSYTNSDHTNSPGR